MVTALIDLVSGEELASASMINAQKHYGLDVLTRITYEYEHPQTGIRELQDAIVHSINGMITEVCDEAEILKRGDPGDRRGGQLYDDAYAAGGGCQKHRKSPLHVRNLQRQRDFPHPGSGLRQAKILFCTVCPRYRAILEQTS